jgi:hypothetical protein
VKKVIFLKREKFIRNVDKMIKVDYVMLNLFQHLRRFIFVNRTEILKQVQDDGEKQYLYFTKKRVIKQFLLWSLLTQL